MSPATVEYLQRHPSGALTAGAFSPTADRVAVLSAANGVQILDVETGERVGVQMSLGDVYVLPLGLQWSEDWAGVWVGAEGGPIRLAADAGRWREIACAMVHRELTAEEWSTLVSESDPPQLACG